MGGRSAKAVSAAARARLHERAQNLTGGILAWIDRVDPTLPKYQQSAAENVCVEDLGFRFLRTRAKTKPEVYDSPSFLFKSAI